MFMSKDYKMTKDLVHLTVLAMDNMRVDRWLDPMSETLNRLAHVVLEADPSLQITPPENGEWLAWRKKAQLGLHFEQASGPRQPDLFGKVPEQQVEGFPRLQFWTRPFRIGRDGDARAAIDGMAQTLTGVFPQEADRVIRIAEQGKQAYKPETPSMMTRLFPVLKAG